MRRSARTVAHTAAAALALTAMGLLAATPASAATPTLYGWLSGGGSTGIATLNATTADATLLPSSGPAGAEVLGLEVNNGVGKGLSFIEGDPRQYFLFTWDPTSGALADPSTDVYLSVDVPDFQRITDMSALDTLADGTLITWVNYIALVGAVPTEFSQIATLDPVTGTLTPVVDLADLLLGDPATYFMWGLATDPISGQTFAFFGTDGVNSPAYVSLNIVAGTHSAVDFFGAPDMVDGFVAEADFAADGTMWFYYGNDLREILELSTIGSPSTWGSATRLKIGDVASNIDINPVNFRAFTLVGGAPTLASTGAGFPVVWLVAGTVAVLAGGVTVVTVRRRKAA